MCRRCGETPWEGVEPVEQPRQVLAAFADSSCPIGGTVNGCPSTTEAQTAQREAEPLTRIERLRDDIATLKQQRAALAGRVTALEQENTALKGRVTALERGTTP